MSELAVGGIPVAVTCRVLKIARQPYSRWLAQPVTAAELEQVYRANVLFDVHRDDSEFGYRLLADEADDAGQPMADRTAWRIYSKHGWWSAFGKKKRGPQRGDGSRDRLAWSIAKLITLLDEAIDTAGAQLTRLAGLRDDSTEASSASRVARPHANLTRPRLRL